jgi:hypothetical protein
MPHNRIPFKNILLKPVGTPVTDVVGDLLLGELALEAIVSKVVGIFLFDHAPGYQTIL